MLYNVVDVVKNHPKYDTNSVDKIRKEFSKPIDTVPVGLPTYEELEKCGSLSKGHSYVCLVPVNLLHSDSTYNRIDEINIKRALSSLSKSKGFSFNHAGTLVAFLRPDGKIVLTQGNHRCAMAFLTMGDGANVVVSLRVHSVDNIDACVEIESSDFITDCSDRWNITQIQRFKGGYFAGRDEYIYLHNLGKKYNIAIGGVSDGFIPKKTFKSFSYLTGALKFDPTPNKIHVNDCLSALSKYLNEKDIKGYSFWGLLGFKVCFNSRLELIKKANPLIFSFEDFVKYVFNDKKTLGGLGPCLTQHDLTKESTTQKDEKYYISKYVALFNEYALARNLCTKSQKLQGKYAIPESCDEWSRYHSMLSDNAKKLVSVVSI